MNQNNAQALDPVQQKAKDLMVRQAMSFLLKDEHAQHIIAKAKAGDPKAAVIEAMTPLLQNIHQMASVAGAKVEMVTVLVAGIEITAALAKMLEVAGVMTEQEIPAFCVDVAKEAVAQHNAKVQSGQQPPQPGGGMAGVSQPQGV